MKYNISVVKINYVENSVYNYLNEIVRNISIEIKIYKIDRNKEKTRFVAKINHTNILNVQLLYIYFNHLFT